jgi:ATP-dependent helicase HepA
VKSPNNNLGAGKILSLSDSQVEVEYFCSVGERIKQTLPLTAVQRLRLESQTRCYIWSESEEKWLIGRIFAWNEQLDKYQVYLPNSQTKCFDEAPIYVRCNRPITDPIDTLAWKGHETPYFHDRRLPFVRSLIKQRAVSRGMAGLFSANIKLYPHQVEVIRRVLEDPVQRYLLADEVGLGKTIEAGTILRQYLLDEPQGRAIVLVPKHLVEQWRKELDHKFYLSDFSDRVQVIAVDDWHQIKLEGDLDFLIIDEAHHIAGMAASSDRGKRQCFQALKKLAHQAKRLLLLSATPVLNHERDFLAMLHLLEPATYRLEDLEGFQQRVQKRQEIGRILLSFREGTKPFVLKTNLKRLKSLFAEDRYLLQLITELESCLQKAEASADDRDRQVRLIRNHIGDTYRLHRRMLRNRRESVEDAIFDRNPTLTAEYDLDERGPKIHELLEEWRIVAPQEVPYQQLFLLLFRASGTWLGILEQAVEVRLRGISHQALNPDFSAEEIKLLTDTPKFEEETEILEALLEIVREPSEEGDRLQLLKMVLLYKLSTQLKLPAYSNIEEAALRIKQLIASLPVNSPLDKIVVFTSFTRVCHQIVRVLNEAFGKEAIASYYWGQSSQESEKNIEEFCQNHKCLILVCDRSGEEGRNLQFANWAIYFDLPPSPNQLEQRIGRVDRIGSQREIKISVFTGPELEDSPQDAWYQLLKKGLNIFNSSIASLQFYVDKKLPELEAILFESGAEGILERIEQIQQETEAEKIKISEQNTLDEIDALNESAKEYFQELDNYDAQHQEIMRATEGWFRNVLQFKQDNDCVNQGLRRYKPTIKTLIPVSDIIDRFADCLREPGTYNRRIANRHQNRGARLYRIGEKLIDALDDYLRWEDRGQTFAMWRYDSSWDPAEGMEWFGFRFNYEVEVDLEAAKIVLKNRHGNNANCRALKRFADSLFPPRLETMFLDSRYEPMSVVEEPKVLDILQHSDESKHFQDDNLAKNKLSVIDNFVTSSEWPHFCQKARTASETLLRQRPSFIERGDRFAKAAERKLDNRIDRLHLRLNRISESEQYIDRSLERELAVESDLKGALLEGIRNPRIRLDSVGFMIIAGYPPQTTLEQKEE